MEWLPYVFDPRGRASRASFWRTLIGLGAVAFGIAFAVLGTAVALGLTIAIDGGALFAVHVQGKSASFSAPVLLLAFAPTAVRRLHDRGKGAWWLAPFYILPLCCTWLADAVGQVADTAAAALPAPFENALTFVTTVLLLAGLVLSAWSFIELGFRRGTWGPNRFGADPNAI